MNACRAALVLPVARSWTWQEATRSGLVASHERTAQVATEHAPVFRPFTSSVMVAEACLQTVLRARVVADSDDAT